MWRRWSMMMVYGIAFALESRAVFRMSCWRTIFWVTNSFRWLLTCRDSNHFSFSQAILGKGRYRQLDQWVVAFGRLLSFALQTNAFATPRDIDMWSFWVLSSEIWLSDLCHRVILVLHLLWSLFHSLSLFRYLFKVSAKEAVNVEQAFIEIARDALKREAQDVQDFPEFPDQIRLDNREAAQPGGGCNCWERRAGLHLQHQIRFPSFIK